MTKNPDSSEDYAGIGDPPVSTGPASAALASDPGVAADTVTGAPGRVDVPGTKASDYGQLSSEAADELGTILQAMEESDCWTEVQYEADGTPILIPHCKKPDEEPSPFLQLWLTGTLVADNIAPHWKSSVSRYEAALNRASIRSEKIRVLADKAVDLLDAASSTPYYSTGEKQVLSAGAKAQCQAIADRVRAALSGPEKPLADLFEAVGEALKTQHNRFESRLRRAL